MQQASQTLEAFSQPKKVKPFYIPGNQHGINLKVSLFILLRLCDQEASNGVRPSEFLFLSRNNRKQGELDGKRLHVSITLAGPTNPKE
jgi:hypothetical protein